MLRAAPAGDHAILVTQCNMPVRKLARRRVIGCIADAGIGRDGNDLLDESAGFVPDFDLVGQVRRHEELLAAPSSRSPGGGASRQNLLDSSVPKPLLLALIGILDAAGELMRGGNVAFQTLFAIPLIHPLSSHARARVTTHGT